MNKTPGPQMKLSIRHHLIVLVLVAVIPVVVFSAVLVSYLSQQRSQALEVNLLGTTKALNSAVDEQIISMTSSLTMLSEVEDFGPSRIQYLHQRLRHFVNSHPGWVSIALTDTSGVQIFNTHKSYSTKLPRLNGEKFFKEMLATKEAVISGYRLDSISQEPVISVAAPVKRNGYVIYGFIASMDLRSFSRFFSSRNLPSQWKALIVDRDSRVLAASKKSMVSIGEVASNSIREKAKLSGSHTYTEVSKFGKKTFGSTSKSKITGWTIVLDLPDDGLLYAYKKTIFFILMGGGLLLVLSILFAIFIGRKISKPILAISNSAKALGQGQTLREIRTSLSEIQDVNIALKLAAVQRTENEDKIRSLYDEAQQAVSIRDTFMSVASHELKTPLTSLNLQLQMLDRLLVKKETISRDELYKPFSRIQDQVKRLGLLVDDLLDVSRISSGKMEYHPEVFDLVVLTNEIVHQFDHHAQTGTTITVKSGANLVGNWDRHRLEQVIVNLLTNAIKYGNSKPITVSIIEEGHHAIIEVQDQGFGISPEDLGKIFEKFERVGDRQKASGLGLGLWIVNKIVEGLGGSISVESVLNTGSTFRVKLPIRKTENVIVSDESKILLK